VNSLKTFCINPILKKVAAFLEFKKSIQKKLCGLKIVPEILMIVVLASEGFRRRPILHQQAISTLF